MGLKDRLNEFTEEKPAVAWGAAGVVVLLLGGLLWTTLRPAANTPDVPHGTHWTCDQGHVFSLSVRQLSDHHANHFGEPVPCAKCSSTKTKRMEKCPKCGELYPMERSAKPCPKCGTSPNEAAS
jgi:hypothetical protein